MQRQRSPKDGGASLCVGLLHQRAPELVAVVRVAVNQLVVHSRQAVINHYVHPVAKAPEAEVENSSIGIWLLWVPFLLLPVRNDLGGDVLVFKVPLLTP